MSDLTAVAQALSQLRERPAIVRQANAPKFSENPPFLLVTDITSGTVKSGNFFGLKLPYAYNAPGTRLSLSVDDGAEFSIEAGDELLGPFAKVEVLTATAPASDLQNFGLALYQRPDFYWIEVPGSNQVPYAGGVLTVGPNGASSQLYNTANGNAPVLISDGRDATGAKAVRAYVQSTNGNITGGSVRFWYGFVAGGFTFWFPTQGVYTLASGALFAATYDVEFLVPVSYVYAELESGTNAGGSGDFGVTIQLGY